MTTQSQKQQSGFTLVELSVTVALLMLVLVPTLMSLSSSERSTGDLRKSTEARAQARHAVDAIARELRQAQTGDPALTAVTSISPTAITFHSPDKSTPFRLRRITYQITGTALTRSEAWSTNAGTPPWTFGPATAPVAVIENVRAGSSFTGKTRSGTPTSLAADVRVVNVTVVVNGVTARPGAAQTFTQTVELRAAV
jgi:prepilin-type N-terminal cleavage/methylation domain-containing protein